MHIVKCDTWTLGVSWLDRKLYGEGGLQLHFGKSIVCFWPKPKPFCTACWNEGHGWPLYKEVWHCPSCDTEYRDE